MKTILYNINLFYNIFTFMFLSRKVNPILFDDINRYDMLDLVRDNISKSILKNPYLFCYVFAPYNINSI